MAPTGQNRRGRAVFLYVPNIIGYARLLFASLSISMGLEQPKLAIALYLFAFACDELDGRAARALNQESEFGKALDMVTDRLSTAGLCFLLAVRHPTYRLHLFAATALDIGAHWLQMHSTLASPGKQGSHKDVAVLSDPLLRLYYGNRVFMGACCVSVELLYLSLLGMDSDDGVLALPTLPVPGWGRIPFSSALALACLPGYVTKQVANCSQIRHACLRLALGDGKHD